MMKQKTLYSLLALTMTFTMLAVAQASMASAARAAYETIDRDGEPFKAVFNADSGKVRVVMLVAPT